MKRPPRKIPTPKSLANVALHYLGRFVASEASLRRVLLNRMRRVAMENASFASDKEAQTLLHSAIETIIATHKRTGVLNDASFAEMKVSSLRRQGRSRNAIKQKLAIKGISSVFASDALDHHDEDRGPEESEIRAARILARKRRLGPYRDKPCDEDRRRKEFGTMARAGFSAAVARRVLHGPKDERYDEGMGHEDIRRKDGSDDEIGCLETEREDCGAERSDSLRSDT